MGRKLVITLGLFVFSVNAGAHEMTYKACKPRTLGCFTGRYSLGGGLGWSKFRERTSFWPNLRAEIGVSNHVAVELELGGTNPQQLSQSLSGAPTFILGAGVELYFRELYRGLLVRALLVKHLYRQDLGNQRYSPETGLMSTVGWRWRPEDYAGSFSLGVGAQKVLESERSIQPVLETQVAIDFNFDSIFY